MSTTPDPSALCFCNHPYSDHTTAPDDTSYCTGPMPLHEPCGCSGYRPSPYKEKQAVSTFVDPGPNPEFPDRPDTQDFRDLSVAVQSIDMDAMDKDPQEVAGVDVDSILYMAKARIAMLEMLTGMRHGLRGDVLRLLYLDAFTLGKTFAENRAYEASKDETED